MATVTDPRDRSFFAFNAVVSTAALVFLGWLLYLHQGLETDLDLSFMPAVNACWNALSALCLTTAWVAIRNGHRELHKRLVVTAFAASTLFLVGYVAYHAVHGDTRYPGEGVDRVIYLAVLASHVLLSMSVVPLALTCFWFAYREQFDRHRRVARWAMPIWLYVSVTGVLIFLMLHGAGI